ncbi:MAG: hypothetical protein FWD16_07150 [Clostridia bacterium]|nr:hypothetical protein [Clostridia bacterium]
MGLVRRFTYNPQTILAALKQVDGTGSGLDADLLQGIPGTGYAQIAGNNNFTGQNSFAQSPVVPEPTTAAEAANKGYVDNAIATGGGGGPGVADHNALTNRDLANQHPTSAITGLAAALATGTAAAAGTTKLYSGTGTNTDGAMTQAATTAALATGTDAASGTTKLYSGTGQNTDGAMTQAATTAALTAAAAGDVKTLAAVLIASMPAEYPAEWQGKIYDMSALGGTWTNPFVGKLADIYATSGGGGGAGGSNNSACGGGGGGGYCKLIRGFLLDETSYPVTIGAGGSGGMGVLTGTAGSGQNGGVTSAFGLSLPGGSGGSPTMIGGNGGSGGGGGLATSTFGSGAGGSHGSAGGPFAGGGTGGQGWNAPASTTQGTAGLGGGNINYDPVNPYDCIPYGCGGASGKILTGATGVGGDGGVGGGGGGGTGGNGGHGGNGGPGGGGGGGAGAIGGSTTSASNGGNGGDGIILIYA